MKIFISWSGDRSHAVAKALNDWLPKVIQFVKPFYSPEIEKGTKGIDEINASLEGTSFGIICLTRENLESKWIHYEAGALAKTEGARVWTLLLDITHSDVTQPLAQFQHTLAKKDDIFRLLDSINKNLPQSLEPKILIDSFEKWWSDLEDELQKAEKSNERKPKSAGEKSENVRPDREILNEILETLRNIQRKANKVPDILVETNASPNVENSFRSEKIFSYATFKLPIRREFAESVIEVISKSIINKFGDSEINTSEVKDGYKFEIRLLNPVTYENLSNELKLIVRGFGFYPSHLTIA
ncbi:MAG TPA: hypothetical protein VF721_13435 [Pyrinomonadaceae bacterium]|jgi:hypothetical protein